MQIQRTVHINYSRRMRRQYPPPRPSAKVSGVKKDQREQQVFSATRLSFLARDFWGRASDISWVRYVRLDQRLGEMPPIVFIDLFVSVPRGSKEVFGGKTKHRDDNVLL